MTRTTDYCDYQVHMELVGRSEDMFDLWSSIQGPTQPAGVVAIGKRIKVYGGPFSRRWVHLVGELVGWAVIDVILDVEEKGPFTDEW